MYRCDVKAPTEPVFYAFVLNRSSDHAGDQWSPLRGDIGFDQNRHKRNRQDKFSTRCRRDFALNQHNFTLHETLRFPAMFRHRDTAITVSVQPKCASEKTTPQSTASTAPLTQGRFFRCALRIFKYANYRCPVRNKGINHSISHPLIQRKICIVLAGSGSFQVSSAASIPGKHNKCIRSCVSSPLKKRHTELLRTGRSRRRPFCRRLCATGPLRDSALRGRERRRA